MSHSPSLFESVSTMIKDDTSVSSKLEGTAIVDAAP